MLDAVFLGELDLRHLSLSPCPHTVGSVFKRFLRFFLMWTIFKVFIEFVTILFLFYALVFWPQVMWDLSALTRD